MTSIRKVIYWHRFGLKVYDISHIQTPVLEKEIESEDIEEIVAAIKNLSHQTVLLLLADSISYLYEKIIDPPLALDNHIKTKLLSLVSSDIPEDFSDFSWDFKFEKNSENKQKVIIFAPVKQYQSLINQVSNRLSIKIEAMETESIAAIRDPNPIIGIAKKNDINGKDEQTLNISINPVTRQSKINLKIALLLLLSFFLTLALYFFVRPKTKSTITPPKVSPSPTINVVSTPTPEIVIKSWTELSVNVQNGTQKAGLASSVASTLKANDLVSVDISNADRNTYQKSRLIFKDELLQKEYQDKFIQILSLKDFEPLVDNSQSYDAILILGTN